jgi:Tol biopolymer transport system component
MSDRPWLAAFLIVAACGGGGGDSFDAGAPDASTTCDPMTPFGAPQQLSYFGSLEPTMTRFSPDELTAYFSASTIDGIAIYQADRPSLTAPFTAPRVVLAEGIAIDPVSPTVSSDGLRLVYDRMPAGSTDGEDLYLATRSSTADVFGTPSELASVDSTTSDGTPFLSADGEELWFSSARAGRADLWSAKQSGDGFTAPVAEASLNSSAYEATPVLSADRLTVYFARLFSGGSIDSSILMSHRDRVTDPFPPPSTLDGLDGSNNTTVVPTWLSVDQCRLYLMQGSSSGAMMLVVTRDPS